MTYAEAGTTDPSEPLTLNEVAEKLGVHYNTVYRYVRRGRLEATQVDGVWWVKPSALESLDRNRATGRRGERNWDTHRERIITRLLDGDVEGSWDIIAACLDSGATAAEVHRELLGPSLSIIGERWADGHIQIEAEHRATASVLTLRGRLSARFLRRGRTKGTVLLGAAPRDHHAVATALLGDLLRYEGYRAVDLGGDVPAESWKRSVDDDDLVAVAVFGAAPTDDGVREAVSAIRSTAGDDLLVVVGGRAVSDQEHAASIGADVWGGSVEAIIEAIDNVSARRH